MWIALREKKYQGFRYIFRLLTVMLDILGVFFCLYLEKFFAILYENPNMVYALKKMTKVNVFLQEELNMVLFGLRILMWILLVGLFVFIYYLVAHETLARLKVMNLLDYIGYKKYQIFAYEFIFEIYDIIISYIISASVLVIAKLLISRINITKKMFEIVGWCWKMDIIIFGEVLLGVVIITFVCCLLKLRNDVGIENGKEHKKSFKKVLTDSKNGI